jgi:O-antigen ligase
VHTVEVVPGGAQGQWSLVDWRVGAAPVRTAYVWKLAGLTAAALVLGTFAVREVRRLDWSSLGRMFLRWPEWAQTAVTVGLTGLFWAAAALGWGRLSSYSLVPVLGLILSLLVLLPLTFAFVLRLDLGLTLTACSAPFYLVPRAMFYRALALPEVLLVVCLVAWCVSRTVCRGVLGQRRSVNLTLRKPAGADCAVALLLAAALVSSAAAEDRVAGLFELRTIFFLPALGYALVRLARLDDEAKRRIVDGFVVGGMGVALVGLAQAALGRNLVVAEGGLRRLQSVYGSPNNVGLYLGRVWPLLAASAMWGTSRRQRLYALAVLPTTLALLLSFSRGALLLALPAAIVTMGWLARGRFRWLALALVLGIALAFIPLLRLPRFASLLHPGQGTTFFRLKLWRSSLQIVADHPLLGVGPGNFSSAYRTRYVLPAAWQEFNLEHPHNILLDHWTRLGLLGLLAGAAVQVAFWRTICRATKRDPLWLGLAGGMAAVLAHGLVDNSVFFPDLALVSALALAIVADQDLGDGRPRQ